MKRPIEWHEENLKNRREGLVNHAAHLAREEAQLVRSRAQYADNLKEVEFMEHQIAQAKAQGKDGFDEKKFLIPRPNKPILDSDGSVSHPT